MQTRNTTVDIMKGIAIILMIIGHLNIPESLKRFIYSFHMPLFFILVGYFFKEQKSLKDSIKKDFYRILCPYFAVMLIIAVYSFFVQVIVNKDITTFWRNLLIIIYPTSTDVFGTFTPNLAIWFLFSLFWCKQIYGLIIKYFKSPCSHLLIIGIGWVGYLLNNYAIPFNITQGCTALVFYDLGFLISTNKASFKSKYFGIFIVLVWIFCAIYGEIDMSSGMYKLQVLEIFGALGGTYFIFELSRRIEKVQWLTKLLQYMGVNSMIVLCIHAVEKYIPLWAMLHIDNILLLFICKITLCAIGIYLCYRFKVTRALFKLKK